LLKRIPWIPIVVSLLVILSSAFAVSPIRDAASRSDVAEAYLERPLSYTALAPFSNVLDTLTLLTMRQHLALLIGALLLVGIWRVVRSRLRPTTPLGHVLAFGSFLLAVAVTYAAAALLPRPMAALVSDNANILIADFHSHTAASHDVRSGWSVEDNRSWHRGAGFNVAYVTDHATVEAAEHGMANNPRPAAEGVTLLQSIEVTWQGEHVGILGAERAYKGILTENKRDVDEQGLQLASFVAGREPIVIWHHPRQLNRLPAAKGAGTAGVRAIEIVNGDPSAVAHRAQREQIVALAERQNLALTSGTDNHGWGRAAPGWTMLRVFNWRSLQGDALAFQIERILRESGYRGTRVVERRVAYPATPTELWLTTFIVPFRMLTTLSNEERIVWLIWVWGITVGSWLWRRRRASARAA
jgi:hypothetical protein